MLASEFLEPLGWIVVAAAVFAVLARLIRLPSIVAYLAAGLMLGPLLGLVEPSLALGMISEIGIILLLFLVGLELSFDKIRAVGKVAFAVGLGQVAFTLGGGLLLCRILGFGWMDSLFLSFALTFSSTVVAVKLLTDKGELGELYGRIAVGSALVQTLVVLIILVLINGLVGNEEPSIGVVAGNVGLSCAKVLLLFGMVLLAERFLLARIFRPFVSSPATTFIFSLCWCFLVVVMAGFLDLSVEIGALLAGLSLAQFPFNRDLQHRIKPLMNFFVAVFFVALGIQIDVSSPVSSLLPASLFSLFVILGNPFIFFLIIRKFRFSPRTAFCSGVTGAQISEFSFVFVAMGAAAGLVGDRVLTITAMVGVLTIAVSAYLILYNGKIFEWLKRRRFPGFGSGEEGPAEEQQKQRKGHVIVVGMNSLGRKIVRRVHALGIPVVAMDTDERKLQGLPCETLLGSSEYLDVLLEADLPSARLLVSALRIEEANELLAYRCGQFGVPSAIHAVDISMVDNLLDLDVDYLMLSKVDGVKLQAQFLRETGVLPP